MLLSKLHLDKMVWVMYDTCDVWRVMWNDIVKKPIMAYFQRFWEQSPPKLLISLRVRSSLDADRWHLLTTKLESDNRTVNCESPLYCESFTSNSQRETKFCFRNVEFSTLKLSVAIMLLFLWNSRFKNCWKVKNFELELLILNFEWELTKSWKTSLKFD